MSICVRLGLFVSIIICSRCLLCVLLYPLPDQLTGIVDLPAVRVLLLLPLFYSRSILPFHCAQFALLTIRLRFSAFHSPVGRKNVIFAVSFLLLR